MAGERLCLSPRFLESTIAHHHQKVDPYALILAICPSACASQENNAIVPGSDPGAPAKPRLGMKLLVNTGLAIVLWLLADWAYLHYYVQP